MAVQAWSVSSHIGYHLPEPEQSVLQVMVPTGGRDEPQAMTTRHRAGVCPNLNWKKHNGPQGDHMNVIRPRTNKSGQFRSCPRSCLAYIRRSHCMKAWGVEGEGGRRDSFLPFPIFPSISLFWQYPSSFCTITSRELSKLRSAQDSSGHPPRRCSGTASSGHLPDQVSATFGQLIWWILNCVLKPGRKGLDAVPLCSKAHKPFLELVCSYFWKLKRWVNKSRHSAI